jgi:uncharacterized membrane protein YgdD (TMEM256/DUF423 family)
MEWWGRVTIDLGTASKTGAARRRQSRSWTGPQLEILEREEVTVDNGSRFWIGCGALLGALAVACGAFAAHGLDGHFRQKYSGQMFDKKINTANGPQVVEQIPLHLKFLADFETGARYQMYHALALIGLGLSATPHNRKWIQGAGICLLLGIAGFSGGLYLYTLANLRWVGMSIVPLGGMISIAGWILFALAAFRRAEVRS